MVVFKNFYSYTVPSIRAINRARREKEKKTNPIKRLLSHPKCARTVKGRKKEEKKRNT